MAKCRPNLPAGVNKSRRRRGDGRKMDRTRGHAHTRGSRESLIHAWPAAGVARLRNARVLRVTNKERRNVEREWAGTKEERERERGSLGATEDLNNRARTPTSKYRGESSETRQKMKMIVWRKRVSAGHRDFDN